MLGLVTMITLIDGLLMITAETTKQTVMFGVIFLASFTTLIHLFEYYKYDSYLD